MPNRGPNQEQRQKGQQNPGTFSPDDDEDQEADQTQLGAQDEQLDAQDEQLDAQNAQRSRKRRQSGNVAAQPAIDEEETEVDDVDEDEEDDETPIGGRQ